MVRKRYIEDKNLQIAMTEYNKDLLVGRVVETQNGQRVGQVGQVYDNEHGSGEQIYAVVILLSRLVYVIL